MDIKPSKDAIALGRQLGSRVHVLPPADSQNPDTPARLGLHHQTMDLVIDDGDHRPAGLAKTFVALWPLVRPKTCPQHNGDCQDSPPKVVEDQSTASAGYA